MHKFLVGSVILVLCTLGWSTGGVGQEVPTPRGELRIVDTDPLNWAWITWNVFEHLVEIDKDGKLVPRLATAWRWLDDRTLEMTLRQGVKFHNGEVFDADIVKLHEVLEDVPGNPRPIQGVGIHNPQFPPWRGDLLPDAASAPAEDANP